MKKIICAVITACFTIAAHADTKVTFEMAAEQDAAARAHNNSVNIGNFESGIPQRALEGSSSNGEAWKLLWKGNTTGKIKVPASAKEIYVTWTGSGTGSKQDKGYTQFPTNAGRVDFAQITSCVDKNRGSGQYCATAHGRYVNFTITGGTASRSSAYSRLYITSVMYK